MDNRKQIANGAGVVIQGDHNTNSFGDIQVTIGTNFAEKKIRIDILDELVEELRSSDVDKSGEIAARFEDVKEEIETQELPDLNRIEKWFAKISAIVSTIEMGADLKSKIEGLFQTFNLQIPWT